MRFRAQGNKRAVILKDKVVLEQLRYRSVNLSAPHVASTVHESRPCTGLAGRPAALASSGGAPCAPGAACSGVVCALRASSNRFAWRRGGSSEQPRLLLFSFLLFSR